MNSGKTIFAQLMDFVPAYGFRKCVDQYNGNHKVISFPCWDQYLCMAFAQLTYRERAMNNLYFLWFFPSIVWTSSSPDADEDA